MGLRVVSRRDAFSPEGGAFGWGFRKNSFVEGDSHRDIVFADGLCGLNNAENARFKTHPLFSAQAASFNRK